MKSIYVRIIVAFLCGSILMMFLLSCKSDSIAQTPPISTSFAKGADVSWVSEMESVGKKFYNTEGKEMECMSLLKSIGMNSIRLRVWVNPKDGWNNKEDVLLKAKRANDLGMRLMIVFHYSDTWADPKHQSKPEAWKGYNFSELKTALINHTTDVLGLLKSNGINPEWVQVGNETIDGMLWEDGRASENMENFSHLISSGYDAVKSVFPSTKVIVHLNNGYDNATYRSFFDGLKKYNAKWDVIGMSVYPYWYSPMNDWRSCNIDVSINMNDMVARYDKEVMIVECGMAWDNAKDSKAFLVDLISKAKMVPDDKCLGVIYWEPQAYGEWKDYKLGAFDNFGKPTSALDAFR